MVGRIHSIESFATVDGPGIRTVLFFQGCPLKCLYCQNVDTRSLCNSSTKEYEARTLVKQLLRFKPYYQGSGGVTASGGEPTFQPEFLGEVFRLCKEEGIHTTLDTSGYADLNKVHLYLPFTDLVLLDIKHLDNEKCIELTGKGNETALEFLSILQKNRIPVILRQVVIPGWTDSREYLTALADLANSYDCVEKVELLPYHKLGDKKWESIGMTSPFNNVPSMSEEEAHELQKFIDKHLNKDKK
jgi:pyruvate formate lyase activating enzyme